MLSSVLFSLRDETVLLASLLPMLWLIDDQLEAFCALADVSSLVFVALLWPSAPLGYFYLQAALSLLLWTSLACSEGVDLVLYLKAGAVILPWLLSLYSGLLALQPNELSYVLAVTYGLSLLLEEDTRPSLLLISLFLLLLACLPLVSLSRLSALVLCVSLSSSLLLSLLPALVSDVIWPYVLSSWLSITTVSLMLA